MAVIRWTFTDPSVPETTTLEMNPNAGGFPSHEKTITYRAAAAQGGKIIIFEGRDAPQSIEFSGKVLTQTQYQTYVTWFNKRRQIRLTDDLGQQFWIYITKFDYKRTWKWNWPYHGDFTVTATVLDWPT